MMSDNAAPTCKQGDGIGLVSGTNISVSQTPCTGQWMAHWLKACRSSSSEDCQLHTDDALTGNILHQFKEHDSLALDQVKSKEFKELKVVRVDVNERYSFGGKGKSNSAAEDDPLSYALRSGETSKVDRGKFKITENLSMKRNLDSINDETSFSEKVSTQQLTESSIKWKNCGSYCCYSLDILKSDFEHFPMVDINRKIETILASKKKSAYGAVSVNMVKENLSLCESRGTSSLVELAPGSCPAAKEITAADAEKAMKTYEGFLPDNAEDMDRASSPVSHGCNYQKTNMVACMFSSGLTYVDPMNNKLTCMQHNLCSCCFSSKIMRSGIESKIGSISKGFRNSWTSLEGGATYLLRKSCPTDFPYSFLTEGHGLDSLEVKGDSSSRLLLDQRRLSKPDGADVNHLPRKMIKCSKHDMSLPESSQNKHDMSLPESCQNLKSADTGERFHKFSSTIKYSLIEDKVDKYQCLRERTIGDSAFTQVNGSSSSKIITIPAKQNYGKKEKSTVPVEKFVSDQDRNDWDDTSANLMAEHNEFSSKVDTVCYHPFHRSSSPLGESFSMPQMGVTSSNLRNSKLAAASSQEVAGRNMETGMDKKREVEHPASTDKATYTSHKEASVSSTESSAADHMVSHVKISDISSSNPLPDHTSGSETCSRWIKRFKDSHSETLSPCAKKFKKGDDSSSEKQQTFSRTQNYNPLRYGLPRFMEEQGKCENVMTLSETVLPSGDSDDSVQLWMRRWCRKDNEVSQTSRPSVPSTLLPVELKVPLEKLERTIPASIGAMALMGKAMNNYRSCRFRREDGSLVWNTEE